SPFEGATVVHDLNQPLTAPVEPFDTVIDAGTTEHVFDIPRALKTVTELCRPGGRILHFVPANQNCGHGFWQFSPELFFSLYSERNGYADTEVFATHFPRSQRWWRVSPPEPGKRVNLNSVRDLYLVCRTTPGESVSSDPVVQQSDYIHMWNRDEQPTQNGVVDRLKRSPLRPVLAPISRQYTASRRRVGRFNPSLERVRSDALGGR
ncbi:MAG: class I SAM-dependent methyltransferase, partial [Ilumatobacter sp.]